MILPGFPMLIQGSGKAEPFTYNMGFEAADSTTGWSVLSGTATIKSAGNARTGSNKCLLVSNSATVRYVIPAATIKGLSVTVSVYHRLASASSTLRVVTYASNQGSNTIGPYNNASTTYSQILFTIPFVPNGVDDIAVDFIRGSSGVDVYFDDFQISAA